MKSLKSKLRHRANVILRSLAPHPAPPRTGWPPLSETPLLSQRRTDARPWHLDESDDDWNGVERALLVGAPYGCAKSSHCIGRRDPVVRCNAAPLLPRLKLGCRQLLRCECLACIGQSWRAVARS